MSGAHISIVSLGVDNLKRATEFYCALGWTLSAPSNESISFLEGGNVVLGLYGRAALAEDATLIATHISSIGRLRRMGSSVRWEVVRPELGRCSPSRRRCTPNHRDKASLRRHFLGDWGEYTRPVCQQYLVSG